MVTTQAVTMFLVTLQRAAGTRRAAPTPIMAPVMVWVVDTGMPGQVAPKRMMEPAVSAQLHCTGVRWVMRDPMVRTMCQPPNRVPRPMAAWQVITTQNGTWKVPPLMPWANSSVAMMPMVFCASLPPWPRL